MISILIEAALRDQSLRKPEARRVVEGGARRQQLLCLCGKRSGDDGRCVAEAIDRPALHEIEIAPAVLVEQPGALAANKGDIRPVIGGKQCRKHDELLCRR